MHISRKQVNDNEPGSLKVKLAHKNDMAGNTETYMEKLFPVGTNTSSTKYNLMQKEEAHKNHVLKKQDLHDFKVPIQVCIDFSEVLRETKYRLRKIVIEALGIATGHSKATVSYDEFLKMNSFIRFDSG